MFLIFVVQVIGRIFSVWRFRQRLKICYGVCVGDVYWQRGLVPDKLWKLRFWSWGHESSTFWLFVCHPSLEFPWNLVWCPTCNHKYGLCCQFYFLYVTESAYDHSTTCCCYLLEFVEPQNLEECNWEQCPGCWQGSTHAWRLAGNQSAATSSVSAIGRSTAATC